MDETTVPVYLIAGFLESGKTTFLQFTLEQPYFAIEGKTLLVVCEEGEVEYDVASLARHNVVLEVIGSEEEFTSEKLFLLQERHRPERVVMEYNGMWLVSKLSQMDFPAEWEIDQHIVMVDASTFQIYMQNMKSLFVDMIRDADMVVFNRASTEQPLANFRRSVVVVNPRAQIVFEDEEGEMEDIFTDSLPFDTEGLDIEIPLEDYGIWAVDAMDHPYTYQGKRMHFQARLAHPPYAPDVYFQCGRPAMTCCSDDISMLGFVCFNRSSVIDKQDYTNPKGIWCRISASVRVEKMMEYQGEEGIVLDILEAVPCEPPKDELVYFN